MGLMSDVGAGAVAIDTAVFIYFIEEDPRFLQHILPLFAEADQGERVLVTSALTLLEVLVVPYRAGNRQLAERYERLFVTNDRRLPMVPGLQVLQLSSYAPLGDHRGMATRPCARADVQRAGSRHAFRYPR